MTEQDFVRRRRPDWTRLGQLLTAPPDPDFPRLYRRVCQDLSQAQAAGYSLPLVGELNQLVWEGHARLYRQPAFDGRALVRILTSDFPRAVRAKGWLLLTASLLFFGLGLLVYFYGLSYPDSLRTLLSAEMRDNLADMYNPQAEHFLQPRDTKGSADMFGFYIYNNISIGFQTFAGGAVAGLGSMVIMVFNAWQLGAAAAWIVHLGYQETFFPFVAGHGAFELTAIVLFGIAGLRLGWSFIAPGRLRRGDAFRLAGQEVLPLVAGSFVFLVIAAVLEAFWSSQHLPAEIKYGVAAGLWLFVLAFLSLGGRRGR